jgi:flagellar biosynthesis regulator FlbT
MAFAESGKCYQALRLARRVVQHEDAVLGRAAKSASREQG